MPSWFGSVLDPLDLVGLRAVAGGAEDLAVIVTSLGEPWLCLPVFTVFLLTFSRWRDLPVARFFLGAVLLLLVVQGLKFGVDRPRPAAVLAEVVPLAGGHLKARAMPSGHTATAAYFFGLCGLILWRRRRLGLAGAVGLATPLAVGWSRIAIGAHWPSDVLLGLLIGFVLARVALGRASNAPKIDGNP